MEEKAKRKEEPRAPHATCILKDTPRNCHTSLHLLSLGQNLHSMATPQQQNNKPENLAFILKNHVPVHNFTIWQNKVIKQHGCCWCTFTYGQRIINENLSYALALSSLPDSSIKLAHRLCLGLTLIKWSWLLEKESKKKSISVHQEHCNPLVMPALSVGRDSRRRCLLSYPCSNPFIWHYLSN